MRLGTGSLWPGYISYNGEIEGNTAIFPKGTLSTSFFPNPSPILNPHPISMNHVHKCHIIFSHSVQGEYKHIIGSYEQKYTC